MKRMSKCFAAALSLALVCSALAGCGRSERPVDLSEDDSKIVRYNYLSATIDTKDAVVTDEKAKSDAALKNTHIEVGGGTIVWHLEEADLSAVMPGYTEETVTYHYTKADTVYELSVPGPLLDAFAAAAGISREEAEGLVSAHGQSQGNNFLIRFDLASFESGSSHFPAKIVQYTFTEAVDREDDGEDKGPFIRYNFSSAKIVMSGAGDMGAVENDANRAYRDTYIEVGSWTIVWHLEMTDPSVVMPGYEERTVTYSYTKSGDHYDLSIPGYLLDPIMRMLGLTRDEAAALVSAYAYETEEGFAIVHKQAAFEGDHTHLGEMTTEYRFVKA